MIPLSSKEIVSHVDSDGIRWDFVPRYGDLERELLKISVDIMEMKPVESLDELNKCIDKILVGWNDSQNRIKPYPTDKKPSRMFSQNEKFELLGFWHMSNRLTVEEKKS